jgi:2-polyprenyl-3-methyl-5-hydroxy-6-metoxy-1,4-benzoquinol methylase
MQLIKSQKYTFTFETFQTMTLIQHKDEQIRFQQQVDNAREYVLPFIEKELKITADTAVLDIGCGDGGVLLPFLQRGCSCTGIELDRQKAEFAEQFLAEFIGKGNVEIVNQNIYEEKALERFAGKFDLIILKDVIEHIPDQERFIPYLKKFLKPGGYVYFGFPPWYMPHGGHQQVCKNKLLTVLPWFHLLPRPLYKGVLKLSGEYDEVIRELLEIKDTGISIERFERIAVKSGYTIPLKTFYLINPIYQYKFGVKPKKQFALISSIPYFRDFVTTCVYYLIKR